MGYKNRCKTLLIWTAPLLLSSCGADAADSVSNALSSAMALLGVSAPTAATSSTLASFKTLSLNTNGFAPTGEAAAEDIKPLDEQVAELEERLDATSAKDCVKGMDATFTSRPSMTCFGAAYHVEKAGYGGGDGSFNNVGATYASHPGGDSGMLIASEAATGEACAAATMNGFVNYASQGLRISQELFAASLCLANVAGESLPAAEGDELDLKAILAAEITAVDITSFAITNAGENSDGDPVYTIVATGTNASKAFSIISSNAKGSSSSIGNVHGYFDISADATPDYFGFSVDYSISGSSVSLTYRSAQNRSTSTSDFFDTAGTLDYSKAADGAGEDLFYIKMKGKSSEGAKDGAMVFAWQAGDSDTHARVFQADVASSAGTGYFSYGNILRGSGVDATKFGEMQGMICDWFLTTTGAITHVTQASTTNLNKAQKQTFTLTDGMFVANVSTITYFPHTTCNGHATYNFLVGTNSAAPTTTIPVTNASVNNLQTIAAGYGIDPDRLD